MLTFYKKGPSFRWMRLLSLLLLLPLLGRAQYSITAVGSAYNQSFDAFAGTLVTQPANWTYSGTDYTPGGYYNRASAYNNSNSTYGLRESTTATEVAFGAKLGTAEVNNYDFTVVNNTGAPITGFTVVWDVEQYSQDTRPTTIDFSYNLNGGAFGTTGVTGTTLTTASTGATPTANLAAVAVTSRSITIAGISLANGQNAAFRYVFKGNNGAGSNPHIGLDNFALTATAAAATPTITSFTPTSGPVGTGVTITGTNFTGATAVTLNGAAVTYTVVDAATITFTVPVGATSGTIAVTTPGGTATSTGTFTVTASAPTITSFTPTSGPVGTSVTVTGTNFTGASAVTLNGAAVTGYTVVNATTITFMVPAGATSGTIAVTTPGGTATSTGTFTVTPAALPDLTVTTGTSTSPTPIAGNYNNVTIDPNAFAVLAGSLMVAGTLTIRGTGGLAQNCQLLTGAGNFDLQAGGTLAICDAAGIAPTGVPTGAILLTGTRTYSPLANYIYNGTVAQVTGLGLPTTVLAVGVTNPANVTLSQALSLTQGLQLQGGNLNTGGFTFTLLSSAAGTAGVVNVSGVVVGVTTVQRFINSSNSLGYRHYSAPVSNTTMADLNAPGFTPTFNPAYNTSTTPGTVTSFPTVFGYDQSRIAAVTSNFSSFDKGWFSPAGPGDPMVVGKGYTVNAPNSALIDFVGTLNNGTVNSGTLSRGSDAAAGWQLLGNPYPSPLDWSTVTAGQRPGMDAAIYVFESAGQYGGSYRANVNGVGGNGNSGNPLVVSSQGYFARVTASNGTGSVSLDNSNRVTTFGSQPSFGRSTADVRPQLRLELLGNGLADRAHVYFQTGATTGVDSEFDAVKLPNPTGLNLTSVTATENLAINGLPSLAAASVLVPLRVAVPQAGSYSLNVGDLANLAGTTVTLIDALTSTRTVLAAGTSYTFSLSTTTATGRFSVEFRPSGALATTPAQALAAQTQLFPNPASASFRVQLPVLSAKATVQATLLNALGQTVLRRSLSAAAGQAIDAEFDVRALAAGVYTLRLDVNGLPVTRKVVVE